MPADLAALLEILDTITSSLDLNEVAHAIVEKLTAIVPAARCSVICLDEEMTRCHVMVSHDDPDLEMLKLDLQKYPEIRRAIETRSPIVVQDVQRDPIMQDVRETMRDLDFKSIVVIPMTFAGSLLGTLCLKSVREKRGFSEREIMYCMTVARASANALKNAIVHHRVVSESSQYRVAVDKLAKILDHSPDIIMTTDHEGRITEFNRYAQKLLGYPREEMIGKPYALLLCAGGEEMAGRLSGSGIVSHQCRLRARDGGEVETELNITVLDDQPDHGAGMVWVGRDVTELKATQLQLLQAEKLSSIGEIISGVAHELSNPLSGVLGFSQLLMARQAAGPMTRELEKIYDSALRCQKIVKNLLSFARVHKPERTYLGVNGIIEKTLDLKRYRLRVNNIEVVKELDPDLPRTMIDFHQMQQVFLNLINNAQHAMSAVQDRAGRLVIRTSVQDGMIHVEVEDNGEGMSEATLKKAFDPFFTTKDSGEGTGLGLSVSYGIVKEHGGRITARSQRGRGTTFTLALPILADERAGDAEAAPGKPAASGAEPMAGRRVLVVDDEPVLIDLMIDLLRDLGHAVDTAANGAEASRKLDQGDYDLVITDVRMPQMSGIELYRKILSTQPDLAKNVIFITGDLLDRQTTDFVGEMSLRTIPKPLEADRFRQVVREMLEPSAGR